MTIKGPDISSFQHGVNVRALMDPFVLMKCTEGLGYVDADYPGWLAQTKATGKIPLAYHFIGPQDPHAQAAFLAAHILDRSVRVMVDFEDEGAFHPTLAQLLALDDAITATGLIVKVNYFPRWKWLEMGSPSLSGLTSRGIGLISSSYPGGSGYPGDSADGWAPYGGVTPMLWQYTDVAVEGGQRVGDMNAYRGTIEQFAVFLGASSPSPAPTPVTDTPLPAPTTEDDLMPAFATGEIPNDTNPHIIAPPPANMGSIGWGSVEFSLGADFGDATVRCAAYVHGSGWSIKDNVLVPAAGDRVNPWGGPLPTGTQKISIVRRNTGPALAWLIEAAHR